LKPRLVLALSLSVFCCAAVPRQIAPHRATGTFDVANLAYLPGSSIPIRVSGFNPPYRLFVSGSGTISGDLYDVGSAEDGTVIAVGAQGLAMHTFDVAATPNAAQPFIAVASYDEGIILHRASPPFASFAALGIAGAPGDVAIDQRGRVATAATDGTTATIATIDPWTVKQYERVPFADELAFDSTDGSLFVTNRDVGGAGALTRVTRSGAVATRVLGLTAEGIAIDPLRHRVYVANVNDGTVSIVDSRSLSELRRFHAIDRVFSLALSDDGSRLFAVSNQSVDSPFNAAGGVVAIDVRAAQPHVVVRSARLTFPVGIAYDRAHGRLYVTDEDTDSVDVLDARTLRAVRAPLRTCQTPWKPTLDNGILFVPCARSNQIDMFDTATLQRAAGAPFATGSYPLAVAVWHGRAAAAPK
jgi:DNA-binding beta-propeller fold protein YncE